jgi:hypothetical protein
MTCSAEAHGHERMSAHLFFCCLSISEDALIDFLKIAVLLQQCEHCLFKML